MKKATIQVTAPVYLAKLIYATVKEVSKYSNNVVDVKVIYNSNSSEEVISSEEVDTVVPTVEEVKEYVEKSNINVSPIRFTDYYNKRNWKDNNGNPVEWKIKIKEWDSYKLERGQKESQKQIDKTYNMMDEWSCA